MPQFITLIRYTQKGITNIKESPARLDAARKAAEREGGTLPLENLGRASDQDGFVDSMTEALITNLAKISALRVVSRTSVMRYKDTRQAIPEIGKELAVDALLEGSVQRERDHVRINVRLVGAPADQHLWAEAYDRDLRDV